MKIIGWCLLAVASLSLYGIMAVAADALFGGPWGLAEWFWPVLSAGVIAIILFIRVNSVLMKKEREPSH